MGLRSVPLHQREPRCCRVAFIGAGVMAREHLRAFADVDCVELSGLYSRTRSRAEKLGEDFGVRLVCDSIAELYERTEADLVVLLSRYWRLAW